MFGVRVKNQFLDLEQAKFNLKLQSPLLFSKDGKEVIPASILFTSKASATKKNFLLLQNPHILTNPRPWLSAEPCEIWANGSVLYAGHLAVTDASEKGVSFRVLVNSIASLADVLLPNIEYSNPVPTTSVFGSAYYSNLPDNFNDYNFACPRVYNPYGFGDTSVASTPELQNDIIFSGSSWNGNSGTICPFPKITAILRGVFKHANLNIENCFDDSDELKRLLLYFANPWRANGPDRYDTIDIANHVPKAKATEFLKNWVRHFNLGLIISHFDGVGRVVKAEDLVYKTAAHDWTRKVLTGYVLSTQASVKMSLKTPLPSVFPSNVYELKKYTTTSPTVDVKEYLIEQYNKDYLVKIKENKREYVQFDRHANFITDDTSAAFDSKITTLGFGQVGYPVQNGTDFLYDTPMSADRNSVGYEPSTSVFPMFFLRDSKTDNIPIATNDVQYPTNENVRVLGQNARHSVTFKGESGVYNRFWKNWTEALDNARRLEVQLNLTIADLRKFSFDEKVRIGNLEYFVESIDLEFAATGLLGAKAVLIQLV